MKFVETRLTLLRMGTKRQNFYRLRDDIISALRSGETVSSVWRRLNTELEMSLQMFSRYCRRLDYDRLEPTPAQRRRRRLRNVSKTEKHEQKQTAIKTPAVRPKKPQKELDDADALLSSDDRQDRNGIRLHLETRKLVRPDDFLKKS